MKPRFDTYCASCNAAGKSESGKWLYHTTDYDGSIKASIKSIYSTVYTRGSMPVGIQLSLSELNKFKTWHDARYSAN